MIVVKLIGILLLVLLCLGIGLAALLMCLPARVEVRRRMPDGPLRVRVGFGPFRRVWTRGQRRARKPKQKKQPEQAPARAEQRSPRAPRVNLRRLDYEQALSLACDLIDDMTGAMTWARLHVTVLLHTPDAAQTGRLLGALSALVGNLYPHLARAFVLEDTKIVLDADFDAQRTVWGADIAVMTRLGRFPPILWRRRKALWALWKSVRMTEEDKKRWEAEHAAAQPAGQK
ncbi:MAG TPA: DUF2953 domain-containing protein [Candidatus Butyricicoccus stercorigallinarum]|nr:DUF2953 domain-containing protein [Candidatus Butyricicoccus stercorigallinarum]